MYNLDFTSIYLIIHQKSGLALQVPMQEIYSKNSIQFGPINQQNSKQLWIFQEKAKGQTEIISAFPDKVLTVDGNFITLKQGKADNSQLWTIDTTVSDKIKISLAKSKDRYLSFDNGNICIKKGVPFDFVDTWEFRPVTKNQKINNSCIISCSVTNQAIDVPEGSSKEGQSIVVWNCNYRLNQRWVLHQAGEVYVIKSLKSDLNLDVPAGNFEDRVKIIQWYSNGGLNQFWKLQESPYGSKKYRISLACAPEYELGHNNKKLKLYRSRKHTWKIQRFTQKK